MTNGAWSARLWMTTGVCVASSSDGLRWNEVLDGSGLGGRRRARRVRDLRGHDPSEVIAVQVEAVLRLRY